MLERIGIYSTREMKLNFSKIGTGQPENFRSWLDLIKIQGLLNIDIIYNDFFIYTFDIKVVLLISSIGAFWNFFYLYEVIYYTYNF